MSMFSQHYLIQRTSDNQYWSGEDPKSPSGWTQLGGVRIFGRPDAELIRNGILAEFRCRIVEDE